MKILANLTALVKRTDANLPFGKTIQDETETQQGTPIVSDLFQDLLSNIYRLLEKAKITPTNAFDGDTEGYQIIDALQKLPNTMNDVEQVLTLDGTTWSVDLDLDILPNKYFFLARASDDYDVAETYDFKGSGDDTYLFTSEVFKTGNLLLIIIDTGTVRCYTISKSFKNVLDNGSTAIFTSTDGDVLQIDEVVNSFSDFYHQKSITSANNENQVLESLAAYQSIRNGNFSNATYQATNQDVVAPINGTSGFMNLVRNLYKEIFSSGHTGSWNLFFPTPKTGATTVNVNINMPYREKTGDYSVATIDLIDDYANDAAAAASDRIPVGGLYHTAGIVKVRLT